MRILTLLSLSLSLSPRVLSVCHHCLQPWPAHAGCDLRQIAGFGRKSEPSFPSEAGTTTRAGVGVEKERVIRLVQVSLEKGKELWFEDRELLVRRTEEPRSPEGLGERSEKWQQWNIAT